MASSAPVTPVDQDPPGASTVNPNLALGQGSTYNGVPTYDMGRLATGIVPLDVMRQLPDYS